MTIAPAASPAASSQLIETALRAAAGVTGMQQVYIAAIEAQTCTWRQVHGAFPGITAGLSVPLGDTFCARLLAGAPPSTADAAADPAYSDVPLAKRYGIRSYVGVPLRDGGAVTGTLCGIDSHGVAVPPEGVRVLAALARVVSADSARDPAVRLHRTATGWEVEQSSGAGLPAEDLTVAMSLADVIATEGGDMVPAQRPQRPEGELGEIEQLRMQITQLEHALSARVVIEQAIGVVAQRFALTPREAFDRIRKSARSRGQRVHDLAVAVVRSARDRTVSLPRELRATE